ncbi:MAG TPA: ATP-dependent DNA helicase RecG [Candidatus Vogelbacteria bacterium]|nr:ATP-dependent DNA helicase RecG [Candidatus Vogelbacteria bacterium]
MKATDKIVDTWRLNPSQKKALEKLKIFTIEDLLNHFPSRYSSPGNFRTIEQLTTNEQAIIRGKVLKIKIGKAWKSRRPIAEAMIADETGKLRVIWFNQPYLAKSLTEGEFVELDGKITGKEEKIYMANPEIRNSSNQPAGNSLFAKQQELCLIPIYPESKGISSGWFYYHIQQIIKNGVVNDITDPLPPEILKKYKLPSITTSYIWLHFPKKTEHLETAKKRFAFQEVFCLQAERLRHRLEYKKKESWKLIGSKKPVTEFISNLPYKLTKAQKKAIDEIVVDLKSEQPMLRLLEGDVGSGKTAVAGAISYLIARAKGQVAYMAPTEILARQHFESFIANFPKNVKIGLLTSSTCLKFPSKIKSEEWTKISKSQLLKWLADGEVSAVVGTQALIQKKVTFKDLAMVIVDEQHRFGVAQRSALTKKGQAPHLLSMTATPIPRTLALSIYGDLDLSILDELPKGRQAIHTGIIKPDQREIAYESMRQELKKGRQAFVICPRIEEPDPDKARALNVKAAKSEYKKLSEKIFPEFSVGLLHGKQKPAEKEEIMEKMAQGKIDILVSTSVVEVGINIPNANVIMIEGADRFGLAQLHQLRGRISRSPFPGFCYLLTESSNQKSLNRLKNLAQAKNGFDLAELDMAERGIGVLTGSKQWGMSDLAMEAIKNIKMMQASRNEATEIMKDDPDFKKHPLLKKIIADREKIVHWE